jgi:hypothetical protein
MVAPILVKGLLKKSLLKKSLLKKSLLKKSLLKKSLLKKQLLKKQLLKKQLLKKQLLKKQLLKKQLLKKQLLKKQLLKKQLLKKQLLKKQLLKKSWLKIKLSKNFLKKIKKILLKKLKSANLSVSSNGTAHLSVNNVSFDITNSPTCSNNLSQISQYPNFENDIMQEMIYKLNMSNKDIIRNSYKFADLPPMPQYPHDFTVSKTINFSTGNAMFPIPSSKVALHTTQSVVDVGTSMFNSAKNAMHTISLENKLYYEFLKFSAKNSVKHAMQFNDYIMYQSFKFHYKASHLLDHAVKNHLTECIYDTGAATLVDYETYIVGSTCIPVGIATGGAGAVPCIITTVGGKLLYHGWNECGVQAFLKNTTKDGLHWATDKIHHGLQKIPELL